MVERPHTRRRTTAQGLVRLAAMRAAELRARTKRFLGLLAHSRGVRRRAVLRAVAILALVAAAVGGAQNRSAAERMRSRWGPTTTVMVARQSLAAGSLVHAEDLERREVPISATSSETAVSVPPDAVLTEPIRSGAIVHERHLSVARNDRSPPGSVAVRLDPVVPPPQLDTGDLVDVVGASAPGAPVTTVARRVTVLRAPVEGDSTLEVAVSAREAAAVTQATLGSGVAVLRRQA